MGTTDSVLSRTLENGLEVMLRPIPFAPVASVHIACRVGPLRETSDTCGYSHLCEHMMFRGSERFGPGTYWRMVQCNGGVANAYTSRDITVYYCTLPSRGLRNLLEMEADRLFACSMNEQDLESEKAVILEEDLLGRSSDPGGALDDLMYETAFGSHPYGRPITGRADDIRSFDLGTLREFHSGFYRPSNIALAVAGDISPEGLMKEIEDLFGGQGKHSPARPEVAQEPPQRGLRRAGMEHPSRLPRISMGFRTPGGGHRDYPALSLVSVHLSAGRSSRFEELLVRESLALAVHVSASTLVMPGLYTVSAVLPPDVPTSKVEDAVRRELRRIAEHGIEENALEKLRRRRRASSTLSDADPSGMSERLSTGMAKFEDPFHHWNTLRALDDVTADDIRRVASEYLTEENSTVAVLDPLPGATSVSFPEPSPSTGPDLSPPSAQSPSEVDIPPGLLVPSDRSVSDGSRTVRLNNGMLAVLRRDTSFPTVAAGFSCAMGSRMEPEGLTGLADMTARTMLCGPRGQDSVRFNARLEELGTSMDFSAATDIAGGMVNSLSGDTDEVIAAVSDMLRDPAFREDDIERVRKETVSGLEEWLRSPVGAAMASFLGQSTDPPERSPVPSVETLEGIRRKDILNFHGQFCRPSGTVLAFVGAFDEDRLLASLHSRFEDWADPGDAIPEGMDARTPDASAEARIELEGTEQIAVVMGAPAPPRLHDDSYAIAVLSGILGEGIGSRIGRCIREEGLAYHVSSFYTPMAAAGRFGAVLLTSRDAFTRACGRLRREFDALAAGGAGEDELALEKASRIGRQELGMMRYDSISRTLLSFASLGIPLDHDRMVMGRVSELTAGDVARAASDWLGRGVTWVSIAGGEDIPYEE